MVPRRVADVESPLVGREGQAVRLLEVVGQEAKRGRARVREVEGIEALEMKRPLCTARPRKEGR